MSLRVIIIGPLVYECGGEDDIRSGYTGFVTIIDYKL